VSLRKIEARSSKIFPDIKELISYKDLFFTLAWRDFRVRYAQTTIGVLWAIIQPVATIAILTFVFGFVSASKSGIPNALFTVTGLSIWTYCSFVMTNSGNSIIGNQGMIKKIYFPRLIIPISKALVGFIDFAIVLVILCVMMVYYQFAPSSNCWQAPLFILFGVITSLGIGIWLSALTVRFRDFQHVVPFLVQIGLYVSPVAYPTELITRQLPEWARAAYYLNPMAGIIEGFRWSVIGNEPFHAEIWISISVGCLLFISSLYYFNKIEDDIADYV
jgi:lipopolysaccharide transport system permease protein